MNPTAPLKKYCSQYPPGALDARTGATLAPGGGAILAVTAYTAAGGIAAVRVVAGGRGYGKLKNKEENIRNE